MHRIVESFEKWEHTGGAVVVFFVLWVLSRSQFAALYGYPGTDSSVFEYIAMIIQQGYMPYVDTFDHKGPLLYLINYFDWLLLGWRGPLLSITISLVVTFSLLYKMCRWKCSKAWSAAIIALSSMALVKFFFEGGNFSEDYSMLFISIAVYLYTDYLLHGVISGWRVGITGFCLSAVLLMQPNLAGLWCVFATYVLWRLSRADLYQAALMATDFFVGMALLILPVVIWLYANNALAACWQNYIVFNTQYAGASWGMRLYAVWDFFIHGTFLVIFSLLYLLKKDRRKDNEIYGLYLLTIVFDLLLISMGGRTLGHYGMILIPLYAYPLSSFITAVLPLNKWQMGVIVVLLLAMAVTSHPRLSNVFGFERDTGRDEIISYIVENTTPDDRISVWGTRDYMYVRSHRLSASYYSFQFPIQTVHPSILERYFEDLRQHPPKLVMLTETPEPRMVEFLAQYGYEYVKKVAGKGETDTVIYKRCAELP